MRPKLMSLFAVFALFLAVGLLVGADKKGRSKKKGRGLPPGYQGLNLKEEQIDKIAEIQGKNRPKLGELAREIAKITKEIQGIRQAENAEMEKLLTDEQKATLKDYRDKA